MKTQNINNTLLPIKHRILILIMGLLSGSVIAQQNYYLDTAVYTSNLNNQITSLNTNIQSGDSIIIRDTFHVNSEFSNLSISIHFRIDGAGVLFFHDINPRASITIGSQSSFYFTNGGTLAWNAPCNANKFIQIGAPQNQSSKLASCSGGSAEFSFADIMSSGYITEVGILPVEIQDFKAELTEGISQISWTSIYEIQCDYYRLEKSTDGTHWYPIATLPSQGGETTETHYVHSDLDLNTTNYYRLIQYDTDGRENHLSQTYLILNNPKHKNTTHSQGKLYPNPCAGSTQITLASEPNKALTVQIQDSQGKMFNAQYSQTGTTLHIELENYPSGVYIITLKSDHETESHKLIKY